MNREEFFTRCKKIDPETVSHEAFNILCEAYTLLDFDKDTFCKMVNATGIDAWLNREKRWQKLHLAEYELNAKRRYLEYKQKLQDMAEEQRKMQEYCDMYEKREA